MPPNQPLVELATCQEALREAVAARVRLGAKVMVLEEALRVLASAVEAAAKAAKQAREALEGKPS